MGPAVVPPVVPVVRLHLRRRAFRRRRGAATTGHAGLRGAVNLHHDRRRARPRTRPGFRTRRGAARRHHRGARAFQLGFHLVLGDQVPLDLIVGDLEEPSVYTPENRHRKTSSEYAWRRRPPQHNTVLGEAQAAAAQAETGLGPTRSTRTCVTGTNALPSGGPFLVRKALSMRYALAGSSHKCWYMSFVNRHSCSLYTSEL